VLDKIVSPWNQPLPWRPPAAPPEHRSATGSGNFFTPSEFSSTDFSTRDGQYFIHPLRFRGGDLPAFWR